MSDSIFNEEHARLHYRFLNHTGWTELRFIPPDDRKPDLARLRARYPNIEFPWYHTELVQTEDQFIERIAFWCNKPSSPYQCYVGIRDTREQPSYTNRFGGLSGKPTRADAIVAVQTLVLDIEPTEPWRPRGTASTDEQLAACYDFATAIANWCERQGWIRPVMVMSGNGYHLYFAVPRVAVMRGTDEDFAARLRAFEAFVREAFLQEAKDHSMKVDTIADLPRIIKVWGTRSIKGDSALWRVARPVSVTTRQEDPALWDFISSLDVTAVLGEMAAAKQKLDRRIGRAKLPTDAIADIDPDTLTDENVAPIDSSLPEARDFFANLPNILAKLKFDRSAFMNLVLCALLYIHHKQTGIAIDRLVIALLGDREALRRIFKQWQKINFDLCWDDQHDDYVGGRARVHRYFMDYGLGYLANKPEKIEGIFYKWEGAQPRECTPPALSPPLSWEQRRQAMAKWMRHCFNRSESGVFVNNAEPSISKTGEAIRLMAEHADKRFIYLAHTHELLTEVRDRAMAERIPPADLFVVQGLTRLCMYPGPGGKEKVVADRDRGVNIVKKYCNNGGLCGLRDVCPYYTQKAEAQEARIVLAPSAYAADRTKFLGSEAWGNDTRDALFIDEDATGYLKTQLDFHADGLQEYRESLRYYTEGIAGVSLNAHAEAMIALADFILAFLADDDRASAEYDALFSYTPDDRRRTVELMEKDYEAGEAFDYTRALDLLLQDLEERRLLRDVEHHAADYDEAVQGSGADTRALSSKITFYKNGSGLAQAFVAPSTLPDMPIFLLDGTASVDYYKKALHGRADLSFFLDEESNGQSYVAPAGRIVQIVDSTYSREKLRDELSFGRLVASIRAFVVRRREENPARRFLLITYKDGPTDEEKYKTRLKSALGDLPIAFEHFGAIRGLDKYAGWDTIIVGGFTLPSVLYAREARGVLGAKADDWDVEFVPYVVPTTTDRSYEVKIRRYKDAAMQAVFEQKTYAEQHQAIARSRVLHPDYADCMVVVFNNYPLPRLLVDPMRLHDFNAENGIARPARYARGTANLRANVELRCAIASVLADMPHATREEVASEVERRAGISVSPMRIGQLWGNEKIDRDKDEMEQQTYEVLMRRAEAQIERELRAQGIHDEERLAALVAYWAPAASQTTGLFYALNPDGTMYTLTGVGITRREHLAVQNLLRLNKRREKGANERGKRGKGRRSSE